MSLSITSGAKITIFYALFFVLFGVIFFKDSLTPITIDKKENPLALFENCEIKATKNGITTTDISAKRIEKYKTKEEVVGLLANDKQKDSELLTLKTKSATRDGDFVVFRESVEFTKEDSFSIHSEGGRLDIKKSLFEGDGEFLISHSEFSAKGMELKLDYTSKDISAKSIKAVIKDMK